jgi:hypothetical protein
MPLSRLSGIRNLLLAEGLSALSLRDGGSS